MPVIVVPSGAREKRVPPRETPEMVELASMALLTVEQVKTPAAVAAVKTWLVQVLAVMRV